MIRHQSDKPLFDLGRVVATQGALEALERAGQRSGAFLLRHQTGDWGDLCDDDKQLNDEAIAHEGDLKKQSRVLSAYVTKVGDTIWIITEWDRSFTTLLLPSEY
ncbi:hypothetical protein [Poriferisphaera sp. WC338]|uniref:hypothetical protein n=1 Tax=Poriferisphaera sp. WC338 TaxID=3425129 RepID=UPI003D8199F0